MKKLSALIGIIIAGISMSGCGKSYLQINTPNPNAATNATPELVITNAMTVSASFQVVNEGPTQYLSGWMGYWAPSGSYATNGTDVASYYQTNNFANGLWTAYYRNLEDYYYVETTAKQQNKPYYVAMAKIMKSLLFGQLVDMFNNVPYSQAFQGTLVIQPKYDSGQAIYNDLSNQLDSAVTLMNSGLATASPNTDIMFNGNNASWIAFANTLRLRLLMRQTQMSGRSSYINGEIAKIMANGGGFLSVDAAVNPGYANNTGQQNPFWGYFVTLTGLPTSGGSADYWRASAYAIATLQAYNDPRLGYIYSSIGGGSYVGNVLGSSSNIPGQGTSSMGPGLLQSVGQNAIMLSAAESNFLQSEAIVRGYLPGNAQTAYTAGVTASFKYLGAPGVAAYLIQNNANTNWSLVPNTPQAQIAVIIRQKWIAENGLLPMEAYADYRRLGLPADIPISISAYRNPPNSVVPVRYLYPTSEYNTNAANVNAQGTIDPYNEKVFWNQ